MTHIDNPLISLRFFPVNYLLGGCILYLIKLLALLPCFSVLFQQTVQKGGNNGKSYFGEERQSKTYKQFKTGHLSCCQMFKCIWRDLTA